MIGVVVFRVFWVIEVCGFWVVEFDGGEGFGVWLDVGVVRRFRVV